MTSKATASTATAATASLASKRWPDRMRNIGCLLLPPGA
jgi:hypothetical protein